MGSFNYWPSRYALVSEIRTNDSTISIHDTVYITVVDYFDNEFNYFHTATTINRSCFAYSEGGFFKAHLYFPKEYPLRPPKMKFVTEIWHPNSMLFVNIVSSFIMSEYDGLSVLTSLLSYFY